jgi:predicted O-methyltransferase YrrM
MRQALGAFYQNVTDLLPPAAAARIDGLWPSLRRAWGGPLNGQERRRQLVRSIANSMDFDVVLETGTYRGTSTEFFAAVFGVQVETVEANPRYYAYSWRRFARQPRVRVSLGDSRQFLRQMATSRVYKRPFVYLDAHWDEDLPLRAELEIIRDAWDRAIVMIDDFAVPGDPGYGYDDYGAGKALERDYLPSMAGWALCYPAVPSAEETGERRGCGVLLSPALTESDIPNLRFAAAL